MQLMFPLQFMDVGYCILLAYKCKNSVLNCLETAYEESKKSWIIGIWNTFPVYFVKITSKTFLLIPDMKNTQMFNHKSGYLPHILKNNCNVE